MKDAGDTTTRWAYRFAVECAAQMTVGLPRETRHHQRLFMDHRFAVQSDPVLSALSLHQ